MSSGDETMAPHMLDVIDMGNDYRSYDRRVLKANMTAVSIAHALRIWDNLTNDIYENFPADLEEFTYYFKPIVLTDVKDSIQCAYSNTQRMLPVSLQSCMRHAVIHRYACSYWY